jgi:26S proteasome regulatory subunit N5
MQVYEPFKPTVDTTHRHIRAFLQQLCQHNLRVLEKYYSRISLRRVGGLLGVSQDRVEAELGDMVVNNRIKARINRLEGIVTFQQRKQFTNERLGNWNESVAQILDKVEQTCHFINREKINSA